SAPTHVGFGRSPWEDSNTSIRMPPWFAPHSPRSSGTGAGPSARSSAPPAAPAAPPPSPRRPASPSTPSARSNAAPSRPPRSSPSRPWPASSTSTCRTSPGHWTNSTEPSRTRRRHNKAPAPSAGDGAGAPHLPVVHELQGDVEVLALQQSDHPLEVVLLLRADPQLVPLDLGLDPLRPLIPDDLADLLGVLLRDALLQRHAQLVQLPGRLRLPGVDRLQRDPPLHELVLQHVEHGVGPLLRVRLDLDRVARPPDPRVDVPEVEPVRHLLGRLVQGVVDLLPVDLADDVKRAVRHRAHIPSTGNFRGPPSLSIKLPPRCHTHSQGPLFLPVPSHARRKAGCPSGQWERTVNP